MTTDLHDVPPYLIQPLIPAIAAGNVSCAQALGMHDATREVCLAYGI